MTGHASVNAFGNSQDNVLTGNSGNNILSGGGGADVLIGGDGSDVYVIDSADDQIIEQSYYTDRVESYISFVLSDPLLENLTLLGTADLNATGNSVQNVLIGNAGNNILDGGAGADTMRGGAGDDIYILDTSETITENANEGTDTVRSASSHTLGANFENLEITGSSGATAYGNEQNNIITGNVGYDYIDGRGGADRMVGGLGDDTYVVDSADDVVVELENEGYDRIYSYIYR